MGESVIEATVVHWLVKLGERIAVGDAVVELETDKVTLEVNAQYTGILSRFCTRRGRMSPWATC